MKQRAGQYHDDDLEDSFKIGDMSLRTEDLNKESPAGLLTKVRSLALKQSQLDKQILGAKHEIEEYEKEKVNLENEIEDLQKLSDELKGNILLNTDSIRDLADQEKDLIESLQTIKDQGQQFNKKKPERRNENTSKEEAPPRLEKKKLDARAQERSSEKQSHQRSVPQGSKSYDSFGGESEDMSNYLILKKKFDEIHVFIARIAGMLSKSIQETRRRHATPEIKKKYAESNGEDLKKWLIYSPTKAQVDKDSKRFYMKFKKRFETSNIE